MKRSRPPADPRGGHTRLYWSMQDSPAWRALSWADQGLYLAIRRKLLNTNNGNIEATLGGLSGAGITSSATLAKGLRALMTAGFIDKTRQGGVAYGRKVCSLYRFTDVPVLEHPKFSIKAMRATNEWEAHATIDAASAALRKAHADAKRVSTDHSSGLQNLKHSSSENERKVSVFDSETEAVVAARVHKLNQTAPLETRRKAA